MFQLIRNFVLLSLNFDELSEQKHLLKDFNGNCWFHEYLEMLYWYWIKSQKERLIFYWLLIKFVRVIFLWNLLLAFLGKIVLCLILLNTSVEVAFDTFATVSQNFIELFSAAIESFKHFLSHLTNGLVNPHKLSEFGLFKAFSILELIHNDWYSFSNRVIRIHKHATEHVIGGCI